MQYDFDTVINRRATASYKYDQPGDTDVIELWVADMDFQAAPPIRKALQRRLDHGIFGYTRVPDAYYQAIVGWFSRRHNWTVRPEWVLYTTGVVPAVSATIKALCSPGDKVVMQTPAYNCFFSSINNNQCELLENPLRYDQGAYTLDFDDLEHKVADPRARVLLLCNPHNPTGRLWTAAELERINDICLRHNVIVISDEIHNELTYQQRYVPFARVSQACQDNCVVLCSPTKSFNIAGLQIANIISSNDTWRQQINHALNLNEVCDVNPFGVDALVAAYNESEDWLDALCDYLWGNYEMLCHFIQQHLPQCHVCPLEATYLVWLDVSALGMPSDQLADLWLHQAHVRVNSGTLYDHSAGQSFIRINLACPRSVLAEGLQRMVNHLPMRS